MDMPLFSEEDFYRLDAIGLTIGRGLIPSEIIEKALEFVDLKYAARADAKFPILGEAELFMELMTHPWVVSGCQRVMGQGVRFDHCFGLKQGKGATLANLHGGPQTCQGASFYVSGLAPEGRCWTGRVSVGFTLTEQNPSTGGMCYIAGSHKSSHLLHGKDVLRRILKNGFASEAITVPSLQPGDITFFVDSLVHGATPWQSDQPRAVLYYMYAPGFVAWRPYEDNIKYLPLAKSTLQQQLLRPPYVAEIQETSDTWGSNEWRKPSV